MANDDLMLMNAGRVERSLRRIAHQIVEINKEDKPVILLGINERGFLIANKLAGYLTGISSAGAKSLQLKTEDDSKEVSGLGKAITKNILLLLVDDVIFSGTTMFKALKLLAEYTDLEEVHTAVLVDRGHRKFPVDAQFVGLELPTKLNEHVSLIVEGDVVQGVRLAVT